MTSRALEAALLMADITGSTPLYEDIGDAAAVARVFECLDQLRQIAVRRGGVVIHTKGDDILCSFAEPAAALAAVREMLAGDPGHGLAIHAGIHHGHMIPMRGDVYGDAVNLTARLATLAEPGEVLMSQSFVDRLPTADAHALQMLDNMTLKGKSMPVEVYSLRRDDAAPNTEIAFGHGSGHTRTRHRQAVAEVYVTLEYRERILQCADGASLLIGRSADCDVLIQQPWVSRRHGTVSVRHGRIEFSDRSSSGTYVSMPDGHELFLRRESVALTGMGAISPAVRPTEAEAEVIRYRVVQARHDGDG